MRNGQAARQLLGAGALLIGGSAMLGYALHDMALVRPQPVVGIAMMFDTALCAALGGVVLLFWEGLGRRASTGLAGLLAALGAGALFENLTGINLHIDMPSWHAWLGPMDSFPGRMAVNTALGYCLIGGALALTPWVTDARRALAVKLLTLAAAIISGCGLLGNLLQYDVLYAWTGVTRMAPLTAAAQLCLSAGVWLCWRRQGWNAPPKRSNARQILATAALVLAAAAAIAGLSGFYLVQRLQRDSTIQDLSWRRDDRIAIVALELDEAAARAQRFAAQPDLGAAIAGRDRSRLAAELAGLSAFHPSAVAIQDARGGGLASSGTFVAPAMGVELGMPAHARLVWSGGFFLDYEATVPGARGAVAGRVMTEEPLPVLDRLQGPDGAWAKTGEMGICAYMPAPAGETPTRLQCFPERLHPRPATNTLTDEGQPRPMARALAGQTGVLQTMDYRGERVLAAYAPVADTGLALALKMDLRELYAPIRMQFLLMLPLLLLLVLLGIAAMAGQVHPLVAELVETGRRAQESEARFRAAAESSPDAFFLLAGERDGAGTVTDLRLSYINPSGERLLGLKPAEATGRLLSEFPRLVALGDVVGKFKRVLASGQPLVEEIPVVTREGTLWLHQEVSPLGDGVAVTARDITGRKQRERRLTLLAQFDSLTGLANRAVFLDRLQAALGRARAAGGRTLAALLYLDLDRFKHVNDTLGHAAGDAILREFARRVAGCVRAADLVARLGGDEFTVLLEGLETEADAERAVKAIAASLRAPIGDAAGAITVTCSIGLVFYRGGECDADALLREADAAMYEVKKRGRDGYFVGNAGARTA